MGDAVAQRAERTTATFALERIRQRLNMPRPVAQFDRVRPYAAYDPKTDRSVSATTPIVEQRHQAPEVPKSIPVVDPIVQTEEKPGRFHALTAALSKCTDLPRSVLVGSFFLNLLGLAMPLAMLQIYDRILPNNATDTLALLTLGLMVAFFLEAVLKVVRSHVMGWAAVHNGFHRQFHAVTHMLRGRTADINKTPAGDWMDSFDALGELNTFFGGNSRLILVDLPLAVIFLAMILTIGGWLALVPLTLITGFAILTILRGRMLREVLLARADQDNKRYDFLVECLSGIHTIKGLAMESFMQRRFERLHKASSLASYDTVLIGNKVQAIGSLFANVTQISIVTVGALLVMNGQLSIGALVCCSLLSSRLTQPVIRGLGVWSELQNVELAEDRAAKFDDLEIDDVETGPVSHDHGLPEMRGAITFDVVSYDPGSAVERGLRDVTLQIAPGEFIGLRGEDGTGRGTLASLIMGDLAPTAGAVTIDGIQPYGKYRRLLNQRIGHAAANPVVFEGTILENITMFGPGFRLEAARRAAQLIGLEEDIHLLPEGYDTLLAQGVGDSLSSGLTQRITIARALATDPKILIFDEANTLLDMRSDRLLLAGLEKLKGRVTTILISNRPSSLRMADRVFEVKNQHVCPVLDNPASNIESKPEPVVA